MAVSSRSKSNVRHKRCIGAAFRLGGMPDSPNEETSLIINTKELCRRQTHLQKKDKTFGEPVYFNGYLASLQTRTGFSRY